MKAVTDVEVLMRVKKAGMLIRAVCAVAMVAGLGGVASGQMRVGDDGRAADANTRVGSGGYNAQRPSNLQLVSPNDIALGNVTGGREFRGSITRDPSQPFGGRSNLPTDTFFRRANAQTGPGVPALPPGTYAVPYYSTSPFGRPPDSFILDPYTGQYIQPPKPRPGAADLQYGVPPGTPVIRPGADGAQQLVLPALGRDENGVPVSMTLTATPLLGLRPLTALSDEDRFLLQRSLDPRRGDEVDPDTIRRLRKQLRETLLVEPQLAGQLRDAELRAQSEQDARRSPLSRGAALTPGTRLDSPGPESGLSTGAVQNGVQLGDQTPRGSVAGGGGGVGGVPTGTGGSGVPQLGGIGSKATDSSISGGARNSGGGAENNALMAELRRIEQERVARRNAQMKPGAAPGGIPGVPSAPVPGSGRGGAGGAGAPGAGGSASGSGPTTNPSDAGTGVAMVTGVPEATNPDAIGYVPPLKVGSLAERQGSSGLKALLGSAEKLMSSGRYASAADRYQAAMRFAPRDPTIVMAVAQAELAAGFFARAESSLRQAVELDPVVLNAQYDLRKAWGDKRVDQLVSDLKRIATEDKASSTPVVLLAYLAYNGGEDNRAAELLSDAAQRNPRDPLIPLLRSHWTTDGKSK